MSSLENIQSVTDESGDRAPRGELKSYSPIQLFFLMRLSYLQRQRREVVNVLDAGDWRMKLLNRALYSTYRDCVGQNVVNEARLLIAQPTNSSSS